MTPRTSDERGSALILAVIAMMILGILGVSFALLSRIETTIGHNYRQQAQAEALAEAGLERARDTMRTAVAAPDGFTSWLGDLWGGANQTPTAYAGNTAYWYRARVDNDCAADGFVPASIEENAGAPCDQVVDRNETVVVTAWAEAGSGRSRIRAIIGIDNAWKHVCSDHVADNGGLCNSDENRKGNPSIQPADPNDPNGPAGWDELPRPTLGCSEIDVTLHDETPANCPPGTNYNYPYPALKRLVVTGDRSKGNCDAGGMTYQGYFDCALTTPCEPPTCASIRRACVKAGDTRLADTTRYASNAGGCPEGDTGMVFKGENTNLKSKDVGAPNDGRNMYFMDSTVHMQDNNIFGTVVVEGDGGGGNDLEHHNKAVITTVQNNTTHGQAVYGYPLAYLIYDPMLPAPTGTPYAPQNTTADMGSAAGTQINGIVYSGGHVEFNPIVVNGGVVAWEIQTQATSSSYGYNYTYGDAAPPPGFPVGGGTEVKIVRKSFIVCSSYATPTSECD